ncbi:LL-diaminopimelate aminotransferase [Bacillus massiliigorillae]|uniref:LL-diaminopimelate aminotransferase n=1 Tax=Bacillus massiliigorillae TaxID=1243664 RepID=UPI0003A62C6C|nr:LL-diaminopimelate aminotransferase [Bacillus massiliigorillae]
MEIKLAKRMESFSSSIFSELAQHKSKLLAEGKTIIDLSIGSPDLPPPDFVKETIHSLSMNNNQYGYSLAGTKEFHNAVGSYYKKNYQVDLNPETEVLQLMGSQDGLVHLPMVLANPGDIILVPDPGYTAYATGIAMAGATPYFMPLKKENKFMPDFANIPEEIAHKATLMILNFPGNPIPAMATKEMFQAAIHFAKTYNIIILHDFAYSELYYSDDKPISFLSLPGSKEVGIEMNSLSKSYNMAGCRIAYATGNANIIAALQQLKSNLDYGIFFPIQSAATLALQQGSEFNERTRSIYKNRRDCLIAGLNEIGWNIEAPQAGMFVWAELPKGWTSKHFAFELMNRAGVAVTPGIAFGPSGEGYVRIALVQNEETLQQAIHTISKSGMISSK